MLRSVKYSRPLSEYEGKRYQELIELFRKVNGTRYNGEVINSKSNETLADVACSKQRYASVSKYYNQKLKEKREGDFIDPQVSIKKEEDDEIEFHKDVERLLRNVLGVVPGLEITEVGCDDENCGCHMQVSGKEVKENSDMEAAAQIYKEAFELMKSRNKKYGDSWKVLSIQSLANLCEMKLHRIANLDKVEPKIYDEMIDTLNYMVFGILKLKDQEKGKNEKR